MAEGYLRKFSGDRAEIYSAGIEAHGVNPKAIAAMKDDGIDIAHHTSNLVDDYEGMIFDFVITVCDNAKERCPIFPARTKAFHQNFPDPAKVTGSDEVVRVAFASTRDQIREYSKKFVSENL